MTKTLAAFLTEVSAISGVFRVVEVSRNHQNGADLIVSNYQIWG